MSKPQIIFVVGGPGAGKGTQCAMIKKELGLETYSTGDILRGVVKEKKIDGWKELADDMSQGKLIKTERLLFFLKQTLLASTNKKILLDGYPRNQENIDEWNKSMKESVDVVGVLYFDCTAEEMTRRVLSRNEGRADDNAETMKKRLATFEKETRPLVPQLEKFPNFIRIDCNDKKDVIFEKIKKEMKDKKLI